VAIRTLRELAKRFRQNALDCERSASNDLLPWARDHLLKMAKHYRMLADKIDEPGAKWEAALNYMGSLTWCSRTQSPQEPTTPTNVTCA
jgi:hypothetical protein